MGILTKEIEITLSSKVIKHYENLGYKIPKYKDSQHRLRVKEGTKITVKVEDLPKRSNRIIEIKCDCCGKEYEITYDNYAKCNHDGKIYCGNCKSKIFLSGENNPNWNPNKTDEEREEERKYPEYTEFVKKVLARDNYICQCCKDKAQRDVEVHHLDGYNWCKEKRTDETNGITLCKNCHTNFHIIYGRGGNTKGQFEEWIGQAIELVKYEGELSIARKIYCIEEDKIYDSTKELAKEWGCSVTQIYMVCNHIQKQNGAYNKSLRGKHLLWLDEYEKMTEEEVQKYLKWCEPPKHKKGVKVYCITTNEIFDTKLEASKNYKTTPRSITKCCEGQKDFAGKLLDGTKLEWRYYENI